MQILNLSEIKTIDYNYVIFATCGKKKARFIKNQETSGLLSELRIKKPLSKIPLIENIFFKK